MDEQGFDEGPVSSEMDSVVELTELLAGSRLARLAAIASLDESRAYSYDGYTSATAFLIYRCGMSGRDARREVFLARSLPHMEYAVKSAYAGHIAFSQLEILAYARNRHPAPFADDEATLVDAVSHLTVSGTRQAVDHWVRLHDLGEGDEEEDPSRVYLSKTWQDRGRLDGDLDPQTSDLLATALDTLMGEMVRATPEENLGSASMRRAAALAEMARRFLDRPDTPTDHGNRPPVTVLVDWRTLTGEEAGRSELVDGTVISPGDARRLACDARVCRLLTGPEGEILDLGRSQRTVTAGQWKALRVRDRHCQWPGCFRPWTWCDAHHIRHWTRDLGPTDLGNLILLCRYHHGLIHRRGWELTGSARDFTIRRPDGTHLPNAPP